MKRIKYAVLWLAVYALNVVKPNRYMTKADVAFLDECAGGPN